MKRCGFFLFLLALFVVGCNNVTIVAYNLGEREANEIVVLLTSRGIPATKVPAVASTTGGQSQTKHWNISVPAKMITETIAILNQAGLPRAKGTSLLDLFGAQGLVPSEMQNKIRYQEGLSEQLANTIRKMDGIIDADVQITFPSTEDEDKTPPLTASVYIKHRGILDNPNSLLITKIQRLISSALPGLTVDNVSVITDRALFADVSLESLEADQELDFVTVWGVIVSKDSVSLFRTILYLMIVVLFLIAVALVWVIWKIHPLVGSLGVTSLFFPAPYRPAPTEGEAPAFEPPLSPPETDLEESAYRMSEEEASDEEEPPTEPEE